MKHGELTDSPDERTTLGDDRRRPYEPPSLRVVATVEEVTLSGTEGNSDGSGFSFSA